MTNDVRQALAAQPSEVERSINERIEWWVRDWTGYKGCSCDEFSSAGIKCPLCQGRAIVADACEKAEAEVERLKAGLLSMLHKHASTDRAVLLDISRLIQGKASPPAPSGWQQRIAAMDPWTFTSYGREECHFCRATRSVNSPTSQQHEPDCLWQNAKDALPPSSSDWQGRVQEWMLACFGQAIATDRLERCDRFCEEAIELLQSFGYPRERVVALIDYVFGRYPGESTQEVGGVMVTLAALCSAHGIDVDAARETELARVWTKVDQIREKQKAKPTGSALPVGGPRSRAALPSVSEASPAKPQRECVIGEYCRRHQFIHGAEAEELRERIEELITGGDIYDDRLRDVLDQVDARDSLAFVEVRQKWEANPSPAKDPIADAVHNYLQPLADEVIKEGHKLAKEPRDGQ